MCLGDIITRAGGEILVKGRGCSCWGDAIPWMALTTSPEKGQSDYCLKPCLEDRIFCPSYVGFPVQIGKSISELWVLKTWPPHWLQAVIIERAECQIRGGIKLKSRSSKWLAVFRSSLLIIMGFSDHSPRFIFHWQVHTYIIICYLSYDCRYFKPTCLSSEIIGS